jgi:hypothetical protein
LDQATRFVHLEPVGLSPLDLGLAEAKQSARMRFLLAIRPPLAPLLRIGFALPTADRLPARDVQQLPTGTALSLPPFEAPPHANPSIRSSPSGGSHRSYRPPAFARWAGRATASVPRPPLMPYRRSFVAGSRQRSVRSTRRLALCGRCGGPFLRHRPAARPTTRIRLPAG